MRVLRQPLRATFVPALAATLWLLSAQSASAQVLLAQSGTAKTGIGWLIVLLGVGLGLHALCATMRERRDVFVITNMRVFRASGVFSVRIATMPITRILDITVEKPLVGRLLGYGHFIFESAAQAQGLRKIRFIPDPDARDLTIQRVVQRSGLRGPRTAIDPQMMEGR